MRPERTHASDSLTADRPRRLRRWAIFLPVLTFSLFCALALLSVLELRSKDSEPRTLKPVTKELRERYQAQTRELTQRRESARRELSVENLLSFLRTRKEEELPRTTNLRADLVSLERREPGSLKKLLPGLLQILTTSLEKSETARLERLEGLLEQAVYGQSERWTLDKESRAHALQCLERAFEGERRSATALLVLMAQAGAKEDLAKLELLRERTERPQLLYELKKTLAALSGLSLAKG